MKFLISLTFTLFLFVGAFAQTPQTQPSSLDTVQVDITKLDRTQLAVWQELKQQQLQQQSVVATVENLTPDKIDKYAHTRTNPQYAITCPTEGCNCAIPLTDYVCRKSSGYPVNPIIRRDSNFP